MERKAKLDKADFWSAKMVRKNAVNDVYIEGVQEVSHFRRRQNSSIVKMLKTHCADVK